MKPEVSMHPLTSSWYFTPTVVIGRGVGWAGGQPAAQQQLGWSGGWGNKGERSTSLLGKGGVTWLLATVMALYRGRRASCLCPWQDKMSP